jgi:hypothetical protein
LSSTSKTILTVSVTAMLPLSCVSLHVYFTSLELAAPLLAMPPRPLALGVGLE